MIARFVLILGSLLAMPSFSIASVPANPGTLPPTIQDTMRGGTSALTLTQPKQTQPSLQNISGKAQSLMSDRSAQMIAGWGSIPLAFEANVGQTVGEVRFLARGPGYTVFLTPQETVFSLRQPSHETTSTRRGKLHVLPVAMAPNALGHADKSESLAEALPPAVVRMKLEGANTKPEVEGLETLPGTVNYFRGNDPAKWQSGIPTYRKVSYKNVYPGIDQVWYGNPKQLEHDFIVAPGADPGQIRIAFEGLKGKEDAPAVRVTVSGDLALALPGGEVLIQKPHVYQEISGRKNVVAADFVLHPQVGGGGLTTARRASVGFKLAAYDPYQPIIIDPVIVYSTYLGGSAGDVGYGIAVDASGNAYVTGSTESNDFPKLNAKYPNFGGNFDAFVFKLSGDGQTVIYSTYLAGSSSETGVDIAVDASGNAYVTGSTESNDFPKVNAKYQNLWGNRDAFVFKLSGNGQKVIYSTYLGGNSVDDGRGIAVDAGGNAYVTGATQSSSFPKVNAKYPNFGGNTDAFVFKLSGDGQTVIYSTYLGGSKTEEGVGIAVDVSGNAYVTGLTQSTDFPTVKAKYPNQLGETDAFVFKLSGNGQTVIYSTYLGGSESDSGRGIGVDTGGNAYVLGQTGSLDFPKVNSLYQNLWDYEDGFVLKFSNDGQTVIYSTYLGGSGLDEFMGIAVDATGNAYVSGATESKDFPKVNAKYPNWRGYWDAFIVKINDATTLQAAALSYFSFDPLPESVSVNTPFDVEISARDATGNLYPYTGTLAINSALGYPWPKQVNMLGGIWTGQIQVDTVGTGDRLNATRGSATGQSNVFSVTGATGTGRLYVEVEDQLKRALAGSAVYLDTDGDGEAEREEVTDSEGNLRLAGLDPGKITVWATEPGGTRQSDKVDVQVTTGWVNQVLEINLYFGRTPVLLVPGILGSYETWGPGFAPNLGKNYPASRYGLKLFDPLGLVGWGSLEDELNNSCFPKGAAPYDWRRPVKDVVDTYLIPAIRDLKEKTGSSKVNIIAHSTGGLVARAYIQSGVYGDDVNKFAMVGTPNLGAVNAYYMWEGGDPKWADDLNDSIVKSWVNSYWEATEEQYVDVFKKGTLRSSDHHKIRQFYGDHIKEIRDLLPTFTFLDFPAPTGMQGIVTVSNKNDNLIRLNANDVPEGVIHRKDVMASSAQEGKVETKVFYSASQPTILSHKAYWPFNMERYDTGKLYEDGVPEYNADPAETNGDGTVLASSALLPYAENWAALERVNDGSHPSLIKDAKTQLVNFFAEGETLGCDNGGIVVIASVSPTATSLKTTRSAKSSGKKLSTAQATTTSAATASSVTPALGITIIGRAQPYLITPAGQGHGVNPATVELDLPDSSVRVALNAMGSSVLLPLAITGRYTLQLTSDFHEESTVVITYGNAEQRTKLRYLAFVHGNTSTFSFNLDPAATSPLSLPMPLMPPVDLRASLDADSSPVTQLHWNTGSNNPAGYHVYGRRLDEPMLKLIGTSTQTNFLTSDPWDDSASQESYIYAVAGVNADGSESFLSDMSENNDRDQDGLTDEDEIAEGLDPSNPDSDGDGFSDGLEIQSFTDPLDQSSNPNLPPTANAGISRSVRLNSLVTLDGSASFDPDNVPQPLSYSWLQSSGPTVTLNNSGTTRPTFTPNSVGDYTFNLVVSDGSASSDPASVVITVPKLGDIDGDGDVDNNDLNPILAARNKPANSPNDLRDLDGNMKIDALDARKLTTLCTRSRCATQ